ncbi:MAG TPA: hypothetical protein VF228_00235 [Iamia sp.]
MDGDGTITYGFEGLDVALRRTLLATNASMRHRWPTSEPVGPERSAFIEQAGRTVSRLVAESLMWLFALGDTLEEAGAVDLNAKSNPAFRGTVDGCVLNGLRLARNLAVHQLVAAVPSSPQTSTLRMRRSDAWIDSGSVHGLALAWRPLDGLVARSQRQLVERDFAALVAGEPATIPVMTARRFLATAASSAGLGVPPAPAPPPPQAGSFAAESFEVPADSPTSVLAVYSNARGTYLGLDAEPPVR